MTTPAEQPLALKSNLGLGPNAKTVADHIEQRLRTWRQQQMNRSGDRLALDDFMSADSIDDLVDFVCDEYALDALLHAAPARCNAAHLCDCQEAGNCVRGPLGLTLPISGTARYYVANPLELRARPQRDQLRE